MFLIWLAGFYLGKNKGRKIIPRFWSIFVKLFCKDSKFPAPSVSGLDYRHVGWKQNAPHDPALSFTTTSRIHCGVSFTPQSPTSPVSKAWGATKAEQLSWCCGSGSLQALVPCCRELPPVSHLGTSPGSIRYGQWPPAASTWARWTTGKYCVEGGIKCVHQNVCHIKGSPISMGLWMRPVLLFAQNFEKVHRLFNTISW